MALVATVVAFTAGVGGSASAAPASAITTVYDDDPQQDTLIVYSASMNRTIPVTVLTPKNATKPSPVLYLLNGAGGGEDSATWDARSDYKKYFSDKNVYVVTPIGGAFSYYTDWVRDDPALGRNKWQTFLTKELPPLIDAHYRTTKVNAIAGISMAGTSVLNLAIAAPKLYRSVAAFSGCARTSNPSGQQYIRFVVEDRGGADMENMWGPLNGPGWRANDPYLNAAKLRGTKIYMTSGTGLPGAHETLTDPSTGGNVWTLSNQVVLGGMIEVAIDQCTRQMTTRLAHLGIPATVTIRPAGTHSWGYWQDDLHNTWPSIARDLRS
ncbi:alpha/beta hydrolase [Gordonia rhizosphera]|uniref:Putative mycolyltransferase n=1 Tax=Gordonia rhizosphera NBRC 16068 TaxID=1108045 RepID=K6WLS1_9ACTN|nr:alpha/beta hydrolase family protein [Gordonia rhizosphera]GAB93107.1 putative mycolyltransferase [Gordonia rhizosphera NBRC 16068]